MSTRLTRGDIDKIGLKPSELARIMDKSPVLVYRMLANPETNKEHQRTPGMVWALVYLWPHLSKELKIALMRGEHLDFRSASLFATESEDAGWMPIAEAPKDATEYIGRGEDGSMHIVKWMEETTEYCGEWWDILRNKPSQAIQVMAPR